MEPGFLFDFSEDALLDGFARFQLSTWKAESILVGGLLSLYQIKGERPRLARDLIENKTRYPNFVHFKN